MIMDMELQVNRLLTLARLMEQALHSDGLWSFRTSVGTTPAFRTIDGEKGEIVFYGDIQGPGEIVELLLNGETMNVKLMSFTSDVSLTWVVRPNLEVAA
jgi:hypothetical protein